MGFATVADAPANLRSIDGIDLSLAQMNFLLGLVTALTPEEEEGEIESALASAKAIFLKHYRIEGKEFVSTDQAPATEALYEGGVDETEDSFRVRQRAPGDFTPGSFRTIDITDGVKAVIGRPKGQTKTDIQTFIFDKETFKDKRAVQDWIKKQQREAAAGSALGQLTRAGARGIVRPVKGKSKNTKEQVPDPRSRKFGFKTDPDGETHVDPMSGKTKEAKVGFLTSLREATVNEANREIEVVILREGMGNARDKNYYTAEAIQAAPAIFEGAQCYADHPTKTEESDRPERSIRDLIGYYKNVRASKNGLWELRGTLKVNDGPDKTWAWDLMKEAVKFAESNPDKDYVGISINADGRIAAGEEGVHRVMAITKAFSSDVVTKAAAGGRFIGLMESIRGARKAGQTREVKVMESEALEAIMEDVEAARKMMAAVDGENDEAKVSRLKKAEEAMEAAVAKLKKAADGIKDDGDGEGDEDAEKIAAAEAAAKKAKEDAEAEAQESVKDVEGLAKDNKALREALAKERQEKIELASRIVADKKLAESDLPEAWRPMVKAELLGKSPKEMDAVIGRFQKMSESVVLKDDEGADGNPPRRQTVESHVAEQLFREACA